MRIDEFESQFMSSVKESYKHESISIKTALLVTDTAENNTESKKKVISGYIHNVYRESPSAIGEENNLISWYTCDGSKYDSVEDLLSQIEEVKPDLIVAKRNLKSGGRHLVYGLSTYIDALTQICSVPVLLLPDHDDNDDNALSKSLADISEVMIETNHLTGDSNLINWGLRFSPYNGKLFLAHLEDQKVFDYYMSVIKRIPEIHTEQAEEKIKEKLFQIPNDFIKNTKKVLSDAAPDLDICGIVTLGHGLAHYRQLLAEHSIDLLLINTKVEGQLAMGGFAYELAVELKDIPLLML